MFGLGATELLIILALVLVLFGAGKLPQLGRGLGEGIRNFKSGLKSGDDAPPPGGDRQIPPSTGSETDARQ
ncbi:MAG: twin-arginine translocase TatA/TatE family subunit [Deltaproteobacteria bacterium]